MLVALAAWAALAAAPASFQTPSGNIGCRLSSGTLRCDVLRPAHARPRPASCDLDFGDSFSLRARGRAQWVCHGDTAVDRRSFVLRYGRTWRRAGMQCISRVSGLTCRNGDGHGFVLSRQVQRRS